MKNLQSTTYSMITYTYYISLGPTQQNPPYPTTTPTRPPDRPQRPPPPSRPPPPHSTQPYPPQGGFPMPGMAQPNNPTYPSTQNYPPTTTAAPELSRNTQSSFKISPDMMKASLKSGVEDKIRRRLNDVFAQAQVRYSFLLLLYSMLNNPT